MCWCLQGCTPKAHHGFMLLLTLCPWIRKQARGLASSHLAVVIERRFQFRSSQASYFFAAPPCPPHLYCG